MLWLERRLVQGDAHYSCEPMATGPHKYLCNDKLRRTAPHARALSNSVHIVSVRFSEMLGFLRHCQLPASCFAETTDRIDAEMTNKPDIARKEISRLDEPGLTLVKRDEGSDPLLVELARRVARECHEKQSTDHGATRS